MRGLPRGGGGRRRGRKEDGTNLPTESISRRRCKSRMLWISLCASRSMSSCGISASFKDTHTAGHRAVPPAAQGIRRAAPPGSLGRVRGVCETCGDEAGGKSTRTSPHSAPRGAGALPPPPPARPRGLRAARPTAPRLSGAAAPHGPAWQRVPGSAEPEPRRAAGAHPGQRLPKFARAGAKSTAGAGSPEPGSRRRRRRTASHGAPPSYQRPRRGCRCQADRVPGKVTAAVQRRAPRSPRPGPPVATPGRGSAPPPSPAGRRAGELPTAPGEIRNSGSGVLRRGGFTQVLPAALAVPAAAVCSAGRRGGGPAPRTLGFRTAAACWHPRGVDILSYIYFIFIYIYFIYYIHINS